MNLQDILYTPLDLPACPKVDLARLDKWIDGVYPQTDLLNATGNKFIAGINEKDEFPWKVVWAKALDWREEFDQEFPEIKKYIIEGLGIPDKDIMAVTLLPKRISQQAKGFWHSDIDRLGLRFYIDFEDTVNDRLLFRKTLKYNADNTSLFRTFNSDQLLEKKVHLASILNSRQPYYINNYCAAHSVENVTEKRRIAVIVATSVELGIDSNLYRIMSDIIVNSALKYHKHALFWHDWNDAITF